MRFKFGVLNKINDISLNFKFMLIYIMCVFIPILSINLIFLNIISNTIREREEENFSISFERAKTDIISSIEECTAVSYSIAGDRTLYEEMNRIYKKDNEYYERYNDFLRDNVGRYITIYNNIDNISIYTHNNTIVNGGNYYIIDNTIKNKEWYQKIEGVSGRVFLYSYIDIRPHAYKKYDRYLSLISRLDNYKAIGLKEMILKIDVDINKFYDIFQREKKYIDLYLVDDKGRIVYSSDKKFVDEEKVNFDKGISIEYEKSDIVFINKIGDAQYFKNWNLIGVANKEIVTNAIRQSRYFIIVLTLVSLFISTVLVTMIVRSYNYRIKKLSKHMSKIEEEQFDLISMNEGNDEIGGLIRNFNHMARKINSLINDVYKLQIQKKDLELERVQAELNFLQSQMNPHFLFNTLNAILVVSVKNNYTEIIEVIKYLSKTLRRLLSWQDDLVSVEEEISFTEMYLKIEKFRFKDKFQYEVCVDSEVLSMKIPKMSIQPLVENACKHGIQSIKDSGIIYIIIEAKNGTLNVNIRDNGNGISDHKLEEILANMDDDIYKTGSIGIRNVYRRLKLYYNEKMEFKINSKFGEGTEVSFKIPI